MMINEFALINKYLKPLSIHNVGSLKLNDDIYHNKFKKLSISVDTYVQGIHFVSSDPNCFLKKVLRSSLSDLYCKGIKPDSYFLSFAINKKIVNKTWLKKIKRILTKEQKKFNITLGGGDTTYSSKFVITIITIGYSKKKPVLRKGSNINDDIYLTGDIGDSFLGLSILKKNKNFGKMNKYFLKKYYSPILPIKFQPFLSSVASSSIDISDGLAQDLKHLCRSSKHGAYIDLNLLPVSKNCKSLLNKKKVVLKNIFSKGDDYQILFTAKSANRQKINKISKKINLKITKIGKINNSRNIVFKYRNKEFHLKPKNMGYTHIF